MTNHEIHIRDPYVFNAGGKYYLYGTRGRDYGLGVGGFDVYTGDDLIDWSEPKQIFDSEKYGMNHSVNWAPEMHPFNGKYYLFATFQQPNGLRGTYSLVSDAPDGPFVPCSKKALTPGEWECLDGTLYVEEGIPYLVFCHEHTQIINGTVCCVRLSDDLAEPVGSPQLLFSGSDAFGTKRRPGDRCVTDGPFLYRGKNGRLYLIWSTLIDGVYLQCLAVSESGRLTGNWQQLDHIFSDDGGHGMIFEGIDHLQYLALHCPNIQPQEHPVFYRLADDGKRLSVLK